MDGGEANRGRILGEVWRAISEWLAEPFKVCRTRLGSRDRFYDHDEEDLTWVEYQWLSRTNDASPRMKRPPPRLSSCLTPAKIKADDDEVAARATPPVTPPSQELATPAAQGSVTPPTLGLTACPPQELVPAT